MPPESFDQKRLAKDGRSRLDQSGKAVAAKFKIALSIIPLMASCELEIDTEKLLTQILRRLKSLDLVGALFNRNSLKQRGGGIILLIGCRGAGKTTYLATLARWPNPDPDHSLVLDIDCLGEETRDLINAARDILEQGSNLPPKVPRGIDEEIPYQVRIIFKREVNILTPVTRQIDFYLYNYPARSLNICFGIQNHPGLTII